MISPQGLNQDIAAYQHMVDSVTSKAQELAQSDKKVGSDLSQIAERYNNLHATAKVWQISRYCTVINSIEPRDFYSITQHPFNSG